MRPLQWSGNGILCLLTLFLIQISHLLPEGTVTSQGGGGNPVCASILCATI